jgi:hypothetical protein
MTLCAAWFEDDDLHFASDSRLMIGPSPVDISIKITSFPFTILEPSSKGLHDGKVLLHRHMGLCAAGDVATTMPVKETLRTLLASLWIRPREADVSMESIAAAAASTLELLWYQSAAALGNDVGAAIALGGVCPR